MKAEEWWAMLGPRDNDVTGLPILWLFRFKTKLFLKKKWFFFIFQNKAGNIRQSYPVRKEKSCPCKIRYDDLNSTWFKLGMMKRRERVRYRLPSPPTSKERQGHPWSHQEGDLLNLKASVHRTYDILENSKVRGGVQILNDEPSPLRNQKDRPWSHLGNDIVYISSMPSRPPHHLVKCWRMQGLPLIVWVAVRGSNRNRSKKCHFLLIISWDAHGNGFKVCVNPFSLARYWSNEPLYGFLTLWIDVTINDTLQTAVLVSKQSLNGYLLFGFLLSW